MGRGRKLIIAGGIVLLLGIFVAFTFVSVQPTGFEPEWLLTQKSGGHKKTYYLVGVGGTKFEVVVTQGAWTLDMNLAEFEKKVAKEFNPADGWQIRNGLDGQYTVWSRTQGTNGYTMYANELDGKLMVSSHMSRRLTWLEKSQRWIRQLFRVNA